jgi:NAD(P)-dependent dehydrogenase (short-subunit alcohol dehydrogenase family)
MRVARAEKAALWLGVGAAAAAWVALRSGSRDRFDLRGRVALVTGGSRGLGLLVARELLRHGCRVAICARDPEELERAREALSAAGEVLALVVNVAHEHEVEEAVRRITEVWGPVEVLVNNAGIIQVGPLASMTRADFGDSMAVNFWGVVHPTLSVLPSMIERGEGRIANITSIGGRISVPHLLPYGCAKFAAVGFSEGLRAEVHGSGVRVTTVVPGLMRTGSPVNALFKGDREAEFSWFAVSSSLRLTTMDPRAAARRIVHALERGESNVTLGWQAKLAQLMHGLAPGAVGGALALANRFLPSANGEPERGPSRGMDLATPYAPSPLTGAMNREALRNNEYGGSHRPSDAHAEAVGL